MTAITKQKGGGASAQPPIPSPSLTTTTSSRVEGTTTRIERARLSICWTVAFPVLLANPTADRMVTRAGYMAVWGAHRKELLLPWEAANREKGKGTKKSSIVADRWSGFWARYLLNQPGLYRQIDTNHAWDLLVPFRLPDGRYHLANPSAASVAADVDVLLYPSVVSLVARIELTGGWTPAELAAYLSAIRKSADWSVSGDLNGSHRNLDGIAHDIANQAARRLGKVDAAKPSLVNTQSVTALLSGQGPFDLDSNQGLLAGFASMQPTDNYMPTRLLEVNGHKNHSSRVYIDDGGHVIWYPDSLPTTSRLQRGLECLHRNHTELVVHIASLASVVAWASDQITARRLIPVEVQPLIQRAALRLDQINTGDPAITYRSSVATVRVAPFLDDLAVIKKVL